MTGFLKRLTLLPVSTVLMLVELATWVVIGREVGWLMDPYLDWVMDR